MLLFRVPRAVFNFSVFQCCFSVSYYTRMHAYARAYARMRALLYINNKLLKFFLFFYLLHSIHKFSVIILIFYPLYFVHRLKYQKAVATSWHTCQSQFNSKTTKINRKSTLKYKNFHKIKLWKNLHST